MIPIANDRLSQQVAFLVEADKLKAISRRTPLVDGSRLENSAEHSWHLVLTAIIMQQYSPDAINLLRVLEMVAVHDLVEIDAGDTFAYDAAGHATKAAREEAAAARLFGLLPADQREHVTALWEEFEAQQSPESRFANALDRLQPLLQNASAGGGSWRTHNLHRDQVLRRMSPIESSMPELWPMVIDVIDAFCAMGVIQKT
jgi:putative hydrolase of HD superfamily